MPTTKPSGQIELRHDHVVPQPLQRCEQRRIAGLEVDIRSSCREISHPYGVTRDRRQIAERRVVLEVLGREDRVLQLPLAAAVDEQPRLGQIVLAAGFSIKLDQRHLDLGMPVDNLLPVFAELPYDEIREPAGDCQQSTIAQSTIRCDGGLDEVTEVVQLVAPAEVLPRLLDLVRVLEVRVQVAVLCLCLLEEADDLVEQLAGAGRRIVPVELVREPFERLVEIGVEERVATAVLADRRIAQTTQILQVARLAQLGYRVRDRRIPVPLLPTAQQPAGQLHRTDRRHRAGARPDRSIHLLTPVPCDIALTLECSPTTCQEMTKDVYTPDTSAVRGVRARNA